MNFSLGGSTGKYWNQFADKFRGGGEGRKMWTGLTKSWQGLKGNEQLNTLGNKVWSDFLGGDKLIGSEGKFGIYEQGKHWYMDKSRKFNPLWEGGLTKPGGSTKDFLDWGEDVAMKSSHHLFGTDVGWADDSSGTGSAVANSDAEDPSLINQGNWERPGEIESALRREESMRKGTLYHDLAKTQSGRQEVKSLA